MSGVCAARACREEPVPIIHGSRLGRLEVEELIVVSKNGRVRSRLAADDTGSTFEMTDLEGNRVVSISTKLGKKGAAELAIGLPGSGGTVLLHTRDSGAQLTLESASGLDAAVLAAFDTGATSILSTDSRNRQVTLQAARTGAIGISGSEASGKVFSLYSDKELGRGLQLTGFMPDQVLSLNADVSGTTGWICRSGMKRGDILAVVDSKGDGAIEFMRDGTTRAKLKMSAAQAVIGVADLKGNVRALMAHNDSDHESSLALRDALGADRCILTVLGDGVRTAMAITSDGQPTTVIGDALDGSHGFGVLDPKSKGRSTFMMDKQGRTSIQFLDAEGKEAWRSPWNK